MKVVFNSERGKSARTRLEMREIAHVDGSLIETNNNGPTGMGTAEIARNALAAP